MGQRDLDEKEDYVGHLKRVERFKRTILIAFAMVCGMALLCMAVFWR